MLLHVVRQVPEAMFEVFYNFEIRCLLRGALSRTCITVQNSLFNYNFILDFTFKIQHLFRNIFSQFISYKVTYLFSD